jgi:hypothetical protein
MQLGAALFRRFSVQEDLFALPAVAQLVVGC